MKKFKAILLMLACVFGFTACGGEMKTISYDEDTIIAECDYMYKNISNADVHKLYEEGKYAELNEDQLDEIAAALYVNGNVRTEGKVLVKGIGSYIDTLKELGDSEAVKPTGEYEFEAKKDELIVNMNLTGPSHNGSVEFMFDKNLHITSMTTNAEYSLSESMKKAAINTGIGMGTVFVMLIVIMGLIKLLGVIPKIQAASAKRKEAAKKSETSTSVDNTIAGIVEREEAEDDLELVAVISAAIAAMEGTSTDGFVVRSIKRIR